MNKVHFGNGIFIHGSIGDKTIRDNDTIVDLSGKAYKKKSDMTIDQMTPGDRIKAANDIIRAALQYKKQITNSVLEGIHTNLNRTIKKDFTVNAKMGIINTMPDKCLEVFLKRIDRLATFAESLGYKVTMNKWHKEKEYVWFFIYEV